MARSIPFRYSKARGWVEPLEDRRLLTGIPSYDTSFNGNGAVFANWAGGAYASVTAVQVLSNGQILAAGQGIPAGGTKQQLFLARFNSNGSPDNTFNSAQKLNYHFYAPFGPGIDVYAGGITPLAGGDFIVNGTNAVANAATNGFLLELQPTGAIDTSFGKGGVYTDSIQSIVGLAAQGSNLLIGGVSGNDFAVSRLTSFGKLDSTFGSGGRVLFNPSPTTSDIISQSPSGGLSVRADGSFIYSGKVAPGGTGNRSGFVANFSANGKLAPAFGSGSGEFTINYGGDDSASVSLNSNGSLAVDDVQFNGSSVNFLVGTVSVNGAVSPLFGAITLDRPTSGSTYWAADSMSFEAGGNLIVVADTFSGDSAGLYTDGGYESAIVRTNTSKTGLDPSFGVSGQFDLSSSTGGLFPLACTLTPDGKLLIGGVATENGAGYSIMLARLNLSAGTGAVTGHVYNDLNFNGKLNSGEALANVPVYLDLKNTGKYQAGDPITTTDVNGFYSLSNIAPGKYTVRVDSSLLAALGYESPRSGLYSESISAGTTTAGVDFALAGPGITVSGAGHTIPDHDTTISSSDGTAFGSVNVGAPGPIHTFTISNPGGKALVIGAMSVPSGFTLTHTAAGSIAPGSSATFSVQLNTAAAGVFSGNISIANGSVASNPFVFEISATVVKPAPTLSIIAADATASEGSFAAPPTTGDFILQRTGITNVAVTVTLQLSGSAHYTTAKKDFALAVYGAQNWSYNFTTGLLTLTLAANALGTEILVTPTATGLLSAETVTLSLTNQASYLIDASRSHGTVTISNQ